MPTNLVLINSKCLPFSNFSFVNSIRFKSCIFFWNLLNTPSKTLLAFFEQQLLVFFQKWFLKSAILHPWFSTTNSVSFIRTFLRTEKLCITWLIARHEVLQSFFLFKWVLLIKMKELHVSICLSSYLLLSYVRSNKFSQWTQKPLLGHCTIRKTIKSVGKTLIWSTRQNFNFFIK